MSSSSVHAIDRKRVARLPDGAADIAILYSGYIACNRPDSLFSSYRMEDANVFTLDPSPGRDYVRHDDGHSTLYTSAGIIVTNLFPRSYRRIGIIVAAGCLTAGAASRAQTPP